ncbi:hypothetical protein Vadar_009371 [Vaccinium darrowii]|uniref:Uncharacterized protein n=1 Tax=Vaccinium darrowii TaxID=229202 RepID=A0ACB7Z468_9ERIC|nr:hypothetical protein Vadar_009371 [Vaccinium darrowii]
MVHLTVHLPREAILGEPVQYRWMYPFERFVSNRARPKSSIAEACTVKECISFCSLYFDGVETVHNRPERNEDSGEHHEGYILFTEIARPFGLVTRDGEISQEHRDIAHWFVLFNNPEIKKYLEEHKNLVYVPNGQNITNVQRKEFPKWFKLKINRLRANKSKVATDELWSLANGPNLLVTEYSGCIINGVRYHTREVDNHRQSQNSGVLAKGDHEGKMYNFYGHLIKHKGVFNIPEVGDGEPPNPQECNDAFQQESMTSGVPIDIEDNIRYHREDVQAEVIARVGPLDGIVEDNADEADEDHEIMGENISDAVGQDHGLLDIDRDYEVKTFLLRPGFLANDVIPDYERLRNEKIKRNNERCKHQGVKTIATSVVSPVQAERTNESGKRNRGALDDDDYKPSEDENDNDYDHKLDDSFEEVSNMGPCLRTTQSNPDQQWGSSMISERVTIVGLAEAKEQANATIADLVEAKEQQGRTLASVLEFLKQQGYTGVS